MQEIFIKDNNRLVSEKEWRDSITTLMTEKSIKNKQEAKKKLEKDLKMAVKKRASHKCSLLFSGGVDSATVAIILKNMDCNFKCFAVGIEGSKDLISARKVATTHGFDLVTKTLRPKDFEKAIHEVIGILKEPHIVNVGVGSVMLESIKMAKQHSSHIFTGLGSEEIFGGYKRHRLSPDLNKECWRGLLEVFWKRDLNRDYLISKHLGVELRTPFLDKDVIKTAMMIPSRFKLVNNVKKQILREVAHDLGLQHEYAFRKKIAAQYGSGFDKVLEKLAKIRGYNYKSDYVKAIAKKLS